MPGYTSCSVKAKDVLGLGLLGWWQKGRQDQVPRSDAWGMGDGVGEGAEVLKDAAKLQRGCGPQGQDVH